MNNLEKRNNLNTLELEKKCDSNLSNYIGKTAVNLEMSDYKVPEEDNNFEKIESKVYWADELEKPYKAEETPIFDLDSESGIEPLKIFF